MHGTLAVAAGEGRHSDVPRPTREALDHRARKHAVRWQVFGLVSAKPARADLTYWPSLPRTLARARDSSSAYDGGRSHLPLRGSPGIPPGSLLRLPTRVAGRTSCVTDHIWGHRQNRVPTSCGRVPGVSCGPAERRSRSNSSGGCDDLVVGACRAGVGAARYRHEGRAGARRFEHVQLVADFAKNGRKLDAEGVADRRQQF
jgi:hypothetical protein